MPVIGRLVKHQLRSPTGDVAHEAVGGLEQRRPVQEMGIGLEGRTVIVEEVQPGTSGVNDQPVEACTLERAVSQPANMVDVGWKRQVEGIHHGRGFRSEDGPRS
ncbi:MAG: hypothetical protein K0R70_2646 [Steroidobacteraceae bacterium]|nr:hypothetical protein [Steroidobacteraceae bacterium]